MSVLERFLKIDGIVAAGEFTPEGKCVNHVGKLKKGKGEEVAE